MANDKDFKVKNDLNVGGDVTVNGTVDGRDIATDGTKLDTIETNAKDDQSITAGSGLTGGGTGDVTLNVGAGTGITVNANDIAIGQAVDSSADVTFSTLTTTGNIIVGGNLQVSGTTTTIDTQELHVTDNMIYMADGYADSAGAPTASVDIGFAAGVNDNGSYEHVGFFRDATDDRFKVFKGYTPEPDAAVEINTGHASFSLADMQAATFYGALSGNASTASQLQTTRTIALSGDVTGSTTFNGSGNATISTTIAANSVALGTDTTGNYVATITGTTNEVEVSGSGSENAGVTIGLPNDVTIGNDLSVTNNISMSGSNLYFDGTNTYLRSDNQFYFLTDGGSAQAGSFKGLQVSTSYSGTVPNNGILFGTDTTLYRSAANTLSTGTGDNLSIQSGQLAVGTSTFSGVIHAHRTTNGSHLVLSNPTSTSYAQIQFDTNSSDAYIFQNGSGKTDYGGASSLNIYNSAGNAIAFHPGNQANTMYMSSGGNVGIGTSTPYGKFHVDFTGASEKWFTMTGGSGNRLYLNQEYIADYKFGFRSGTTGTDILVFDTQNDRVGIGTTSPVKDLDVDGDFYIRGGKHLHMGTVDTSLWDNTSGTGGINMRGGASGTYAAIAETTSTGYSNIYLNKIDVTSDISANVNRFIDFYYDGVSGVRVRGNSSKDLSFDMHGGGNFLLPSGNVGIAQTSPSKKLHIGNGSGTSPHLFLDGVFGTTNVADHARIYFNDNNFGIGAGGNGTANDDDLYIWAYNGTGRDIRFAATTDGSTAVNSGNWTTNVIIKNDGNVGIGTTSPDNTLTVNGGAEAVGIQLSETERLTIGTDGTWNYFKGKSGNGHYFNTTGGGLFVLNNAGNIGLGISSPTINAAYDRTIHIHSTLGSLIKLTDATSGTSETDGTDLLNYGNDTYLINRDAGRLFLSTSNTQRLTILSDGKVGIATTSPTANLNVYVGAGGSNGTAGIKVGGTNNYDSLELGIYGAYGGMIRSYGNDLHYFSGHWKTIGSSATENHSHYWYTSKSGSSDWSTAKMELDHNGNLGIGTTSPSRLLHLSSNSAQLRFGRPDAAGQNFEFYQWASGLNIYATAAASTIYLGRDGQSTVLAAHNGDIRSPIFYDYNNTAYFIHGDNESALNTLRTAGRVVIGGNFSNNPYNAVSSTKLHFGGGNSDANDNYYIGTNMENYGGNYTKLDLRWHTGIRMGAQQQYGGIRFYDSEDLGTVLFSIAKGSAHTRVESGNLHIHGANAPSNHAYLNIGYSGSGETRAIDIDGGWSNNESKSITFTHASSTTDIVGQINCQHNGPGSRLRWGKLYHSGNSGNYTMQLVSTSTSAADLSVTGNITASANVTAYSDESLKDNIEVIPHALDKVKDIRGVTFNRNDLDDNPRHTGVIAQEVEKVLPEVVSENEHGLKQVAYGNMVGLLIEAIKEQQETIDKLQARVEALENN